MKGLIYRAFRKQRAKEMMATEGDEIWMKVALREAKKAASLGEVPVGAVVVFQNEIVGRGHNQRETLQDPSAHAEHIAICNAANTLHSWRLPNVTLYVTLEPCPMCAGLVVNSRVRRVVFGASDPKAGALGSLFKIGTDSRLNHRVECESGVLERECASILREFFVGIREKRRKKAR